MVLLTSLVVLSILFLLADSFLLAGALLLLAALAATLAVAKTAGPWFGFLLFLIYITGLLVLFGYMVAMSANSFVVPKPFKFAPLIPGVGWIMPRFTHSPAGDSAWPARIIEVFYGNLEVYWFAGVVLFLALLMAVSLCYKSPKPLRSFVACK